MRGGFGWTVYTIFVFGFYVADVLSFASLVDSVGVIDSSVTKNFTILALNWASSRAEFSFVAGLSQDADIFFFASVFIDISFAQMSGFCAFKRALLVGADVSIMVLLFWEAIFGLLATVWMRFYWAFNFIIFAFDWAETVAKLNMIPIESFVDADIVL